MSTQLPHDIDAEVSVLTELLLDPEATAPLSASDFYAERHRVVYQAIANVKASTSGVTLLTVIDALRADRQLEAAGGIDYVSQLLDGIPSGIEHHARIVRDKAQLRRLIEACQQSIMDAMDGQRAADVCAAVERRLLAVTETRATQDGFRPVSEAVQQAMEMIDRAAAAKGAITGMPTGLPSLDRMTSGLERGGLTILAARPAMGKSALGWQIGERVAKNADGVLVASYEMGAGQLARRGLSRLAHVDSHTLRTGDLRPEDWSALAVAAQRMSGLPIWINEYPPNQIEQLRGQIQRHRTKQPVSLVVVDYLQQMSGPTKGNRNNEIEHISRGLKRMAREMDVHVLALAQLSRAVEARTPPRPVLSDLRDSGAIEQDADNVLMLWRPEYYLDQETTPTEKWAEFQGRAELIVAKQRDGETGRVWMRWDAPRLAFTEEVRG